MANLYSLNKTQLEALKREQVSAINRHKINSQYLSNQTNSNNVLKRLQQRLSEIDCALSKLS